MPKRTFFRLDEDKRERVIRSAIGEFRVNGFENAKVGAIAKNAGIANGSVYQYFEDKRELFMYCVNWTMENFVREMDRRVPLAGLDVFEYFQNGLPGRISFWKEEPDLALFARDLSTGGLDFPPGEANVLRGAQDAHIPKLVANGLKWGTLRGDIDGGTLVLYLTGVIREAENFLFKKAADAGFDASDDAMKAYAECLKPIIELVSHGIGGAEKSQ